MGKQIGTVESQSESFIDDFKADADALIDRFETVTSRLVGGR